MTLRAYDRCAKCSEKLPAARFAIVFEGEGVQEYHFICWWQTIVPIVWRTYIRTRDDS